jgi:hypothetical protein
LSDFLESFNILIIDLNNAVPGNFITRLSI